LTLKDLRAVKEEFEEINRHYRQAFTPQARLELVERVKKLMSVIKDLETDAGDSVTK
jgi:hypothetical protein